MQYLFENTNQLEHVNRLVIHCDDSLVEQHYLSARYIETLLQQERIDFGDGYWSGATYLSAVNSMAELADKSPKEFSRLITLASILFSEYEVDGDTIHVYPIVELARSAYETIRERLD